MVYRSCCMHEGVFALSAGLHSLSMTLAVLSLPRKHLLTVFCNMCTAHSQPGSRFVFVHYMLEHLPALQVWEAIDAHMDDRRRAIREKKLKEDIEKYRKENPKITEQFADLKRKLAQISEDEWNAIPDIGDYTRHKKNKMEVRQLCVLAFPQNQQVKSRA